MKIKEIVTNQKPNQIIVSSVVFDSFPKLLSESLQTSLEEDNITITIDNIEKYHALSEFLEDKKFTIIEDGISYSVDGYNAILCEST